MSAVTTAPEDLGAMVAGTGVALLKSLPTRAGFQDRSAAGWGDFIRFASSEAKVFTPGGNTPMNE